MTRIDSAKRELPNDISSS